MKPFTLVILQFITIFFLCKFYAVKCEDKRKWLEIGKELYRVEPEGNYTWQQAMTECKRELSNLISPRGDYDYAKLKAAIKHSFKNYSSFWTDSKVDWKKTFLQQIGLGKVAKHHQKCNKFDNSSMFKYLPDDCENSLGFICEKTLLTEYTSFKIKNTLYFLQPLQQFNCEQAYDQCEKREMSLVLLTDHDKNNLLKDYIFIHYGSTVSFWFGYNNETHYSCATHKRGQNIAYNSKLGFICQRSYLNAQTLSTRHLVLLIFLATAVVISITIYAFVRCFFTRKEDIFYLTEVYYPQDIKVNDIK
ncbi:uncharacterized protein LOC135961945 [Calliphora vicina]|uniref:uncharacterized protein LOC135961945 n=1 Tax=Calliphora vicina TaxID=7373 RepID=UPI00325BD016